MRKCCFGKPPSGVREIARSPFVDTRALRHIAHVIAVKIDRTRFADIPESDVKSPTQFLEADVPRWDLSISLTRLRASLQPAELGPEADYRNDPPKIVIENRPAILLLLDGQPKLQAIGQSGLQRVANTAMPVIFGSKTKEY